MVNSTVVTDLPPLPTPEVKPMPDILPWMSDLWLSLLMPVVAYWLLSMFFHVIDVWDLMPQYRLHTPAEIAQRNHVSRYEVARDVIVQQIIQTVVGYGLSVTEPHQTTGTEDYDVAVWATRIRIAQRAFPTLLSLLGINAAAISKNMSASHPLLAGALAGGHYPFLAAECSNGAPIPAFATWELVVAKLIYWVAIPAIQFFLGILFVDTWQYILHRTMHTNTWLYTTFHSRHHRLYVPYAYGALYNHWFEGFLLDTLGTGLAFKVAGMTTRQGLVFFTCSTIKTVDDHCGYALPWDPIQHITSNNAAYHDIHHQSWGIKTNYSQPFFTFWDKFLGTMYKGETRLKYTRARELAEEKEATAHEYDKSN
ncbi:hypothetical protein MKZ38_006482 [Zalerion maritima]|uniref:Fatty acid hydroxylase domain-containing protein n=1 Tax=Zalerion maritima TaxID=339359 RepID=A0AAD5RZ06_9PEZI|nr:hypothetical protein MKZ38_006482 [Zalerion maritima]